MGTKEKLIERLKRLPSDFTWEEFVRLFGFLGYGLGTKGKTSGSRVIFRKGESSHTVHRPHPGNIMKKYALKDALDFLKENKLI